MRQEEERPPFDLEIELPGYVYHRLGLEREKQVQLSIRREALHVIPADETKEETG